MASQSQNMTTDNGYIVFYQIMTPSSQSIPNNTSTVQVDTWVKRTNSGYSTYGTGTVYSTINGVQYATSITTGQTITDTPIRISSKLVTVSHYSDGTFTLPMSAQITHSSFTGAKQSWSVALATIPRASTIATMGSITVGGNVPITLAIQSTGFTHNSSLYCGSTLVCVRNALQAGLVDITYVLTAPEIDIMYTAMASLTTATLTLYVATMSGSTQIGSTVSKTSTATIGAGIIPTIASLTAGTVNAVTGTYIKNVTPITFTMNTPLAVNKASISSYKINFNGIDYPTSTATTGLLNINGSYTATATIVDSRGRSSAGDVSDKVTVNLLDYSTPTITAFTVIRCDSGGVANVMGTYAKVLCTGTVKSLINSVEKNALTYTVFYKLRTSGTWLQAKAPTVSGLAVNLTQTLGTGAYLATASYDWKLEIVDKITLTPIISTVTMSTGAVTMSWGASGVGIGKIWQSGALDVYGQVNVDGLLVSTNRIDGQSLANTYSGTGLRAYGNGATNTIYPSISFYQSGVFGNSIQCKSDGNFTFLKTDNVTLGDLVVKDVTAGGNFNAGTYTDFVGTKAVNGYQKFPSGMIMQWGTYVTTSCPANANTVFTPTLPIAFPSTFCSVTVGQNPNASSATSIVIGSSPSGLTGISLVVSVPVGGVAQIWSIRWIAMGY